MSEVSDLVGWLKEFGTGLKGFIALWSVLVAWILHGFLPKKYEVDAESRKFDKEHDLKVKELKEKADERAARRKKGGGT